MRFSTSESKVMVMEIDAPATPSDQPRKPDSFTQVLYTEKQLLSLIHKKGLLHKDVQELYRNVRDGYESIILNEHDVVQLQEVEHFLWKLHYKHIDEFRKSIRQISTSGEIKGETSRVDAEAHHSISRHFEGFKSFLSEAAEFYRSLIIRFKEKCGLPGELFSYKNGGSSISMDPMKLSKCQFACHRFLICLGDLARYGELCKKQDSSKWSASFTYYLEASRMCPASGNPHNQLALLATYVNDSFLALYHCTRSLAVKEPFPDAWNNLLLLSEESRTSQALPLFSELQLDFLKPFEKISPSISNLETSNSLSPAKTEFWPLFVRLITFFLGRSSLEDFACTLSATVKQLEALALLDDEQLKAALESYELMDSSRRGPYRALQLVSIFVFVLHSLTTNPQQEELNEKDQEQKSPLTLMALIAAFICLARLVERCVRGNQLEKCPLLPAVMVFVEWLVGELDMLEAYAVDEKVMSAMSYFFHVLTDLLNRLNIEAEIALDKPALWEDHELRGFEPLAHAQISLDFTTHWEWVESFNCKRSQRISHVGMRFASRSNYLREWIHFDRKGMKFYLPGSMEILGQGNAVKDMEVTSLNLEVEEPEEQKCRNEEVYDKDSPGENRPQLCQKSLPVPAEEEEVILFKPITRHNSAPLYQYITEEDYIPTEGSNEPSIPGDECLRRATSMSIGPSQSRSDRFSFPSDASNISYNKPQKHQEAPPKESATYPAGPPSLNAWVFDAEDEPEKGVKIFTKHELSPIPEVAVESLASLSIDDMKDSVSDSVHVSTTGHNDPPTYVAPVPSAPLLPDDAIWFGGNAPSIQDYKSTVSSKEGDGILGAAPPIYGYQSVSAPPGPLDFSPVFSGLVHGYPPPILGMSSSEWLYHYRNNQKLEQTNTYIQPVNFSGPGPLSSFYTSDISRLDLLNQRGNPLVSAPAFYLESPQLYPASSLVYGADGRRMDNLFSYQRPSPFVCGAVNDSRTEQQQLLHYLKEKEWQMHSPQLKGSTFMGN